MLPSTLERVPSNTPDWINKRIQYQTEANIIRYAHSDAGAIEMRLHELDQEWDIERCLETMAPTFTIIGITLGLTRDRKWFALPLLVQAFFLEHALKGWCPPLPVLRYLGFRTAAEIEQERRALETLRRDSTTGEI